MFAYAGSRTSRERHARGEGISVYAVSPDQRKLEQVQIVGGLVNPSYLLLNKAGDRLYSVHGDLDYLSTFSVDKKTGHLTLMQQQQCEGKNPVHLALDPTEKFLIVSNHWTSALAVLPVKPDGTLDQVRQLEVLSGTPGPHRVEQALGKPHFNPFDPSGRFVVVPDKGLNRIFSFRFENGTLTPTPQGSVLTRETAGPRHIAFHPTQAMAYVVNELDSTVTAYKFDAITGTLTPVQLLSALPDTYTGDNRAAAIFVHPNGRWLFVSNRGDDSLAVFAIDQKNNRIRFVRAQLTRGKTPRFCTLSPNQKVIWMLNEESDTMMPVALDPEHPDDPFLSTGEAVSCGSPVCLVFSQDQT
jgi:6-phosphogluconolactonase (cycloisomerase 2 family)